MKTHNFRFCNVCASSVEERPFIGVEQFRVQVLDAADEMCADRAIQQGYTQLQESIFQIYVNFSGFLMGNLEATRRYSIWHTRDIVILFSDYTISNTS